MRRYSSTIVSFALALLGPSTFGLEPVVVLKPSDVPEGFDNGFGWSVAMSGDFIAIGAPFDPWYNGEAAGAIYVYRRQGAKWGEHQKLSGSRAKYHGSLGASLAMSGDWLVAGTGQFEPFCCPTGTVVVYRRDDHCTPNDLSDDTWTSAQVLNADLQSCCFGGPVAIHGDVIAIGAAVGDVDPDVDAGRAYVFEWNGDAWTGPETIWPSDSQARDFFGGSIAVHDSLIVVGAQYAGAVYSFRRGESGWTEECRIRPGLGGLFGASVALAPPLLVIGAPGRYLGYGAAFLFEYTDGEWIEADELFSSHALRQHAQFGVRVAARDGVIIVGAYDQPWGFVFRHEQAAWEQDAMLASPSEYKNTPRMATDGRIAVVRDHVYAIGPSLNSCDFAVLQNCVSDGLLPSDSACSEFDFERDGAIDARDLPLFLLTFRGPEEPAR